MVSSETLSQERGGKDTKLSSTGTAFGAQLVHRQSKSQLGQGSILGTSHDHRMKNIIKIDQ